MKFLTLFLSCLALSVAHHEEELLAQFQDFLDQPVNSMINMVKQHLLSEDGTSFQPVIRGMMVVIEPQICAAESKQTCSPDENWIFGCTCVKGFRALGDCRTKPCELFRHFKNNGPASLNQFVNAATYEEKYQVLMDYLVTPISRAFCECPGMIGTSINCARKYDGRLFQLTGMDRTSFDTIVNHVDWKTLKSVLLGFVQAGCGEKDGEDCVTVLANMYSLMGRFVDNTMSGRDVCLSMIRFQEEYQELAETMTSFNMETETFKSFLNRLVDVYLDMERVATCEPRCAEEIRDSFYSCCTRHSWDILTSKPMKKGYQKLLRNALSLFSEDGSAPKLTTAVNKYMSVYDPATFCADQTDVFKVKNEECDALLA